MMPGDVFGDWLIHTCTVEQASVDADPDPLNPQQSRLDWETLAGEHAGTHCRFMPMNGRKREELQARNVAGANVSTHVMQISWDDAPDSLKDLDNSPHPSTDHRITNVIDLEGDGIHTGPLNILTLENPGGDSEFLFLLLLSVQ